MIGLAIKSVLAQTITDFELIVVGDGCDDATRAAVAAFDDPRLVFIDLPKAPYFGYANRNVALERSSGRYVAMCSDDDLLFPDHLEAVLSELGWGAPFVHTQALWVSADGIAAPFLTNLANADERRYFMERRNTLAASCIAYAADASTDRALWPEDVPVAADWALWKRLIGDGGGVAHVRLPTILHFVATWKTERHSHMPELEMWLERHDRGFPWPDALRRDAGGRPIQHAYAESLDERAGAWIGECRRGVRDLTAKLAWSTLSEASLSEADLP